MTLLLSSLLASACAVGAPDQDPVEEEDIGTAEEAVCPGGSYTNLGTCYDVSGPYQGVCGSHTYSSWKCTQYRALINGTYYYYRAYCGPQVEGCSSPAPKCKQNC